MSEQKIFKKTISLTEADDQLLKKLKAENRMTEGAIISYCLKRYGDDCGTAVEAPDDETASKLSALIVQNKELKEQLYHCLNLLNSIASVVALDIEYASAKKNPHGWLEASRKELADITISNRTRNI